MSSAGLSADPTEYRARLNEQEDQQLDAWMIELMRDLSIRAGVLTRAGALPTGDGSG